MGRVRFTRARNGGDCVIILDELGTIHQADRETEEAREQDELLEAMALSLSLAPLYRAKAPPPLPPVAAHHPPAEPRPLPPDDSPPAAARAIQRLPILFPPVGHAWNHSPLAHPKQRAAPKRRHNRRRPRVWPPQPEQFAYFPPVGPGYQVLRRRRHVSFAVNLESEDSDSALSRGDASSGVSTASSYYQLDRYPGNF